MHLRVPVLAVRIAFVALTFLSGAGLAAYIFLWVFVPAGDPVAAQAAIIQATWFAQPLSRGNEPPPSEQPSTHSNSTVPAYDADGDGGGSDTHISFEGLSDAVRQAPKAALFALAGLVAVIISSLLFTSPVPGGMILPILLVVAGIGTVWFHVGGDEGQLHTMVFGVVFIVAAYVLFVISNARMLRFKPMYILISGIVLLLCVGVAMIPWFNHLIQDLGTQRALKEREEERADMTAHLHDGVLQTLALIQLHSAEPQTVFTLARGQERDLREWLYQEHTPSDRSVSAGIKEIAANIEDSHGKPVDVVTVGDAQPSAQTDALLNATNQALLNAVQHGGEPISVYCEAGKDKVEVFVRDHGNGFDTNAIPADRLGIRESIIGRIKRKGGDVEIVSRPQWGTEVRMHMPITATSESSGDAQPSHEHGNSHADSQPSGAQEIAHDEANNTVTTKNNG